jgi:hypothetical protein
LRNFSVLHRGVPKCVSLIKVASYIKSYGLSYVLYQRHYEKEDSE